MIATPNFIMSQHDDGDQAVERYEKCCYENEDATRQQIFR